MLDNPFSQAHWSEQRQDNEQVGEKEGAGAGSKGQGETKVLDRTSEIASGTLSRVRLQEKEASTTE